VLERPLNGEFDKASEIEFRADLDLGGCELAVAAVAIQHAGLLDQCVTTAIRRVIIKHFQRIAFDGMEAGRARRHRACVFVGLANLVLEWLIAASATQVRVEAFDRMDNRKLRSLDRWRNLRGLLRLRNFLGGLLAHLIPSVCGVRCSALVGMRWGEGQSYTFHSSDAISRLSNKSIAKVLSMH
jgi:hypothetical protein